jgi:class 3 adenylate cyclase/pimeloyl-ACP methyl ester carboxylesterase
MMWEEPTTARYLRRIGSFARLALFDRRGTGYSDPVERPPTLEQQMDDLRAVMRAAGFERAALFGVADAGLCAMYAATRPDEVTSLVLYGVTPVVAPEVRDTFLQVLEQEWGQAGLLPLYAPSRADDAHFVEWFARYERASASPGMARKLVDLAVQTDIREMLSTIRVPTLVMHRREDRVAPVALARAMAERIPAARFVEFAGTDNYPWSGAVEDWFPTFEEFLTGNRTAPDADRVLSTVLFTDIVGSTARAAALGDRRWRQLLDDHNAIMRDEISRARGTAVKSTGDGFLATFDGPARAVRCAHAAGTALRSLGVEIRAGVHTGECEVMPGDVGGIAVHIAARVMALAAPGQVMVSSTVKDLVAGSGLRFTEAGVHVLRGVPGEWTMYSLVA